jgi:(2Fe-2S) ferredoxin
MSESFYEHHIFFCQNQRDADAKRPSCGAHGGDHARDYVKRKIKSLGLAAPGKVRVNQAGCLERCEEGPCAVVYPAGVWYTFVDDHDLDEIVISHLQNGVPVARLRLPDTAPKDAS